MSEKKIIAIIDDDPVIVDSIKATVESHGYAAITANSGEKGVEMLKKTKPDFIFCDIMMERIDAGIGTATRIREIYSDALIYALSDIGQELTMNTDIYELGFNGVIQKPVSSDEVIKIIRSSVKN